MFFSSFHYEAKYELKHNMIPIQRREKMCLRKKMFVYFLYRNINSDD